MTERAEPSATTRSLRDRPLGRAALVLGVLVVAFLVARGCTSSGDEISKDEAIAIARREVDYQPERTVVRLIRRGVRSHPYWAVSLSTLDQTGALDQVTVVVIDARTREVQEVRRQRGG